MMRERELRFACHSAIKFSEKSERLSFRKGTSFDSGVDSDDLFVLSGLIGVLCPFAITDYDVSEEGFVPGENLLFYLFLRDE